MFLRTLTAGFLIAAFGATALCQPKDSPTTPLQRKDGGAVSRHEQFLKRAEKGDVDVLFLGDSITEGWEGEGKDVWKNKYEPLRAANFGIGGDRTQHVLWRITDGKELAKISPKVTVLMIGTNNTGTNTAEEIARGIVAVVKELSSQRPQMKILLLGVFPRAGKGVKDLKDPNRVAPDELNKKIPEINKVIARLDDDRSVKYLDINAKFLDKEGGLSNDVMPDYLHLSKKGYEIWAEAIAEPLKDLLAK